MWMGLDTLCHSPPGNYTQQHPHTLLSRGVISPTEYIDCVLDTIRAERNYLNIHLLPQAFNLYNQQNHPSHGDGRAHPSLSLDVMDLSDLPSVLRGMGSPDYDRMHNAAGDKRGKKPVLSKFENGTALLTPRQVRAVCNLYRMDVDLLHAAGGITTTMCDEDMYRIDDGRTDGGHGTWR
jgi:hypothetical protein